MFANLKHIFLAPLCFNGFNSTLFIVIIICDLFKHAHTHAIICEAVITAREDGRYYRMLAGAMNEQITDNKGPRMWHVNK